MTQAKPAQPAQPQQPRRKRGAQPGNTNSLKHGFYSRQFREVELADLRELTEKASLESEVAALRIALRRFFDEYGDARSAPDIVTATAILQAIGATASRIASLMRTQAVIYGQTSETSNALALALIQVAEELQLCQ